MEDLLVNKQEILQHYMDLVPSNVLQNVRVYIISHLKNDVPNVNVPFSVMGQYRKQVEIIYSLQGWKIETNYMTDCCIFNFPKQN